MMLAGRRRLAANGVVLICPFMIENLFRGTGPTRVRALVAAARNDRRGATPPTLMTRNCTRISISENLTYSFQCGRGIVERVLY